MNEITKNKKSLHDEYGIVLDIPTVITRSSTVVLGNTLSLAFFVITDH